MNWRWRRGTWRGYIRVPKQRRQNSMSCPTEMSGWPHCAGSVRPLPAGSGCSFCRSSRRSAPLPRWTWQHSVRTWLQNTQHRSRKIPPGPESNSLKEKWRQERKRNGLPCLLTQDFSRLGSGLCGFHSQALLTHLRRVTSFLGPPFPSWCVHSVLRLFWIAITLMSSYLSQELRRKPGGYLNSDLAWGHSWLVYPTPCPTPFLICVCTLENGKFKYSYFQSLLLFKGWSCGHCSTKRYENKIWRAILINSTG